MLRVTVKIIWTKKKKKKEENTQRDSKHDGKAYVNESEA